MFFVLLLITFVITYLFLKYHYSQWEKLNFPHIKSSIPFGNLWDTIRQKRGFGFNIKDLYDSTKEPFIGIYLLFRPALLIRDPELIKNILTSDFSSFHDRGIFSDGEIDSISENIFALPGEKWRDLRSKLSPTFSSGKLKEMYPTVLKIAQHFKDYLRPSADRNEVVEIKELCSRYTINVIASVVFGVEVDTIEDPDHIFNRIGRKINYPNIFDGLRGMASFLCPKYDFSINFFLFF